MSRRFLFAALCIALLAAWLRFTAIDFGLPNPRARPDETPVVHAMAEPARGDFDLTLATYPSAYVYVSWIWVEVGLRVAPVFGIDPPGGFQKTLLREPELLYLIGRTLSAAAGTAAVLMLIAVARRDFGWPAALAAGLLLSVSYLHVRDSHSFKPDALLSLALVASLFALGPLSRNATLRHGALAGAVVGLATACKLPGILMLGPLYVAAILGTERTGWQRFVPMSALAGGAAAIVVFALTSPYMVFGGEIANQLQLTVQTVFPAIFGEAASPDLAASLRTKSFPFPAPEGLDLHAFGSAPWWTTFVFHAKFSFWYGIGALATLLAPVAIIWGLASRRPLPLLAATAFLLNFVVACLSPALTSRYVTYFVPVLLLLEAGLLAELARRIAPTQQGRQGLFVALAACALALQPLATSVAHNRIAAETDTRVLATRWLEQNTREGDRLKLIGSVLMPYGQPVPPSGRPVLDAAPNARALGEAGASYVVTHDHALYYSTLVPEIMDPLLPHLELLADFDPATEAAGSAVFEQNDAYYIPVAGFEGVSRPGPRIRIYRFHETFPEALHEKRPMQSGPARADES